MDELKTTIMQLLEETFERHHGIYTNRGTSLLETLAGISAAEASIPVGGGCPTLAAQVAHTTFYLEVVERDMAGVDVGDTDWEHIWNMVSSVTPEEWEALTAQLEATYRRVRGAVDALDGADPGLSSILAMVVHSAYHLGVIRQAMCVVKAG